MAKATPTLDARAQRTVTLEDLVPGVLHDDGQPVQERPRAMRVHRPHMPPVVLPLREEERCVLGRHDAADVVFESGAVSRLHGVLRCEGGRWLFEDHGSRNGSFVCRGASSERQASVAAHAPVELWAGDVVELGTGEARIELLAESPVEDSGHPGEDPTLRSPASREFARRIGIAAQTRVPVFLLGPSGCGKTHSARQIHVLSLAPGPFVPINCARLPIDPAALHSELLGHVRGAFTGAESARTGKFFHASGGTLFLDEVDSLSSQAQGFLLDVLEGTGDLSPLGSKELGIRAPIFRLISASKLPLAHSGLRMDLCERLAEGHMWRMPTLPERRDDIPGLVRYFVAEQSKMLGVPIDVTDEAVAGATAAPWPGQIRQLRAMIVALAQMGLASMPQHGPRRILLRRPDLERHLRERDEAFGGPVSTGEVTSVRPIAPAPVEGVRTKADPRSLTREQVLCALEASGHNQSETARTLGIARNTLARRMKEFGIPARP